MASLALCLKPPAKKTKLSLLLWLTFILEGRVHKKNGKAYQETTSFQCFNYFMLRLPVEGSRGNRPDTKEVAMNLFSLQYKEQISLSVDTFIFFVAARSRANQVAVVQRQCLRHQSLFDEYFHLHICTFTWKKLLMKRVDVTCVTW